MIHSGYDHSAVGQARKLERDLRILHAELGERPGHPFTLFNLGMTCADASRHAEAVDFLDRCVAASGERDSHVRKAFAYLVSSHLAVGREDRAEAACGEGLRRFPLDAELRFRRGLLRHRRGDLAGAAAAYRDLLDRGEGPHFGSAVAGLRGHLARHNLALVLEESGDWDGADGQWRAVLAERPDYRPGWRWRGALLARTGRLAEADRLADELLANEWGTAEGWLLRGRVALARGDAEAARTAWRRAADEEPTDRDLVGEAARLLFERCGPPAATPALEALVRLDPTDAAARHNLAAALLESGDARRAADEARESLRLRPDSPATRDLLDRATAKW